MPVPHSPTGTTTARPRTWWEHRRVRAAAERRRTNAERELHRLRRRVRHDLRTVRQQSETTAVVARSAAAELCTWTLGQITARLGGTRTDP